MDKFLPTIVVVVVLAAAFLLMWLGWRRRARRDAGAGSGYPVGAPAQTTELPLAEVDALYVATTAGGEPLERLALPGLSFRGRATVTVADAGVTIAVTGEAPVFVRSEAIAGVATATVTIDRVVEKDGLIRLSWTTSGGTAADSYFRVADPADRAPLIAAIETLLPATHSAGSTTESEV
ncbi:PH-like domain-containing protein [Leifsonia poae]|uniref:PH domain-containing protein n=1 Tax=Leifsonia poae TaxID=110933 RepID=A0A9W6HCZ3_9MICO|nr:hypothetical protein [Leifsonia poae]GLJ78214.1 hypothetical protein GCM10017584_37880 [Leifsonia poae]